MKDIMVSAALYAVPVKPSSARGKVLKLSFLLILTYLKVLFNACGQSEASQSDCLHHFPI